MTASSSSGGRVRGRGGEVAESPSAIAAYNIKGAIVSQGGSRATAISASKFRAGVHRKAQYRART